MLIYNVTVKIAPEIQLPWLQWMQQVHIPGMLATGCFREHRLCRLLEQDDQEGVTYCIQYHCTDMEHYRIYMERHAQLMRDESFRKFGDRFIAFRTLMEVL